MSENNDSPDFLSRLRTRIVELGMTPLIESQRPSITGRIQHPEDLIFDLGSHGALLAVKELRAITQKESGVSIKWDGKPAIVVGRDLNGFVLTDKYGFSAKTVNGLARSLDELSSLMMTRNKPELDKRMAMYGAIWNKLESTIPTSFEGFLVGDLMWHETPPIENGCFVFEPNVVKYKVPVESELGARISASTVGVAFHTFIGLNGHKSYWNDEDLLTPTSDVVLLPSSPINHDMPNQSRHADDINAFILRHQQAIDDFLNPSELRSNRISNLPALLRQYVNSRVRSGGFSSLAMGTIGWLETKMTPQKYQRAKAYISAHAEGFAAIFQVFITLHRFKEHVLSSIGQDHHGIQAFSGDKIGHEGFVSAGENPIKLVDRFSFSRLNFEKNDL